MMTPEEKKAYQRGYEAGRRRRRAEAERRASHDRRSALWQRLFVAALGTCVDTQGWKYGDRPITGVSDRTSLAADFADEGLRKAISRGQA